MPNPEQVRSVLKIVGAAFLAVVVWSMATSIASAAFWFPLPIQPNPGNVPLPPPVVAPNGGGNNQIPPPDVPPPDVPPPNNTPEPASVILGLVGVGAVGLARFWRRQGRRDAV